MLAASWLAESFLAGLVLTVARSYNATGAVDTKMGEVWRHRSEGGTALDACGIAIEASREENGVGRRNYTIREEKREGGSGERKLPSPPFLGQETLWWCN